MIPLTYWHSITNWTWKNLKVPWTKKRISIEIKRLKLLPEFNKVTTNDFLKYFYLLVGWVDVRFVSLLKGEIEETWAPWFAPWEVLELCISIQQK